MMNSENDDPEFEVVRDDDYCSDCGHFHPPLSLCPELGPGETCGDYRCCINY